VTPSVSEQAALAAAHYRDIVSHYGEKLGVRVARKHLAAYIDHAPVDVDFRERREFRSVICRQVDPALTLDLLAAFYDGARPAILSAAA
jgi:tRNA-dihydrouridine synthase